MIIQNIHREFLHLAKSEKKNVLIVAFNLFLILFSYPLVRATSTAMFIEYYGAKNTPVIWMSSVAILAGCVFLISYLQKRRSVFFLYSAISIVTTIIFLACNLLFAVDYKFVAYPYAIWKEVYIVLLVHLSIGYLNSKVSHETARLTYGPLGALGSLGGVLGGVMVTKLIPYFDSLYGDGSGMVLSGMLGAAIICLTIVLFHSENVFIKESKKESPLLSIKGDVKYVGLILLIVMMSQFIINLANFKFNIGLESYVSGTGAKSVFLGKVYSAINLLSFIFQIVFTPILLKILKEKKVHFLIPVLFFIIFLATFLNLGFVPVVILFVTYKGIDYSLFSSAKEMLYFPLGKNARYGAKYVVDMFGYRFAKMIISLILLAFSSIAFVNGLMVVCLIIWLCLVVYLMKVYKEQ